MPHDHDDDDDDDDDGWLLVQRGFSPATFKAWEGLFTLGGPGLHVRGSLEEHIPSAPQNEDYWRLPANVTSEVMRHPISKWGTYVPGVYGRHPLLGLQLINLPWFLWLTPIVDGERLDMERCEIISHERRLDLRSSILSRSLQWRTRGGKIIGVQYERSISAADERLCVQTMCIQTDSACDLAIESGIDADVRTNGFDHFTDIDFNDRSGLLGCRVRTDCGDEVSITAIFESPMSESGVFKRDAGRAWRTMACRVAAGVPLAVEKLSRIRIVRPAVEAGQTITGGTPVPPITGFPPARVAHISEWQSRWKSCDCDIQIEGDAESQRAVRMALFHLLRAHPGEESGLAIDAKGYSGEAYWGRFFWDSEIYLLPFFLHTDPVKARALLEFRIRTLPAARENAKSRGYAGAKYPWEAGPDGTEECPNWIYADQEIHITSDVVYGLAHSAAATGDDAFLQRPDVQDVLVETARYWVNRIDWIEGRPHLLGVMGPDEYTPFSNDNAYTNEMVSFALSFAAEHARRRVSKDEWQSWIAAADLPILRHPDDPSLVLQCEDFHSLADLDFEEAWKERSRTLAAQVPLELLYRSKAIKQADVILMMSLFEGKFSIEERQRAWEHYLPLTTHDSSLSPATHALFAARLGLRDEAWDFWKRACAIDLDVEHGGAAEGIHIANCGMLWQTIVYGFAGLTPAMHTDILTLNPHLPGQWKSLRFPFAWRGCGFEIGMDHEQITVRNVDPRETASVIVARVARGIEPGGTVSWRLGA